MKKKPQNPFDAFLADAAAVACAFSRKDIPAEDYHARRDFTSKHALDIFAESPEKYRAWLDGRLPEDTDSAALRFGSAVHARVLEPECFADDYMRVPDTIKVRRGRAWEEFSSTYAFKCWLTSEESDKIENMAAALAAHPKARALLFDLPGRAEQTVLFRHGGAAQRPCKARLDRVLDGARIVVDIKTCASAAPRAFASAVERFRYDVQAAFYLSAVAHLDRARGLDVDTLPPWAFATVAIEKEPPHAVAVYFLTDWLSLGVRTLYADLEGLAECERTGVWRGYETADDELPVPRWAEANRGF